MMRRILHPVGAMMLFHGVPRLVLPPPEDLRLAPELEPLQLGMMLLFPYIAFTGTMRWSYVVLLTAVVALLAGTIFLASVAILFGAPLFELILPTCLWASFVTTLCIVPTAMHLGTDWRAWRRVFIELSVEGESQRAFLWTTIGTLAGSWMGALALPLDWDMPFQRWPLPLIYGASIGYIASNVLLTHASMGHDDRAKRS